MKDPKRAELWRRTVQGELPSDLSALIPDFRGAEPLATRQASSKVLNALAAEVPSLVGGSADLAGSNGAVIQDAERVSAGAYGGRNLAFGVREHGMGALANGMALHGGLRPYAATFLVFSDYMRPSIRLAALMGCPVTYLFTHDSIFVGEDGPTHQPVEHVAALRAIPNLHVWRPADARETAEAWRAALTRTDGPVALSLTRQGVPTLEALGVEAGAPRGGYVAADCDGEPELVLVATGSEVSLAVAAAQTLNGEGRKVRAVSVPCLEVFEAQEETYRSQVLGEAPRLCVEAGVALGLAPLMRAGDRFHGMHGFGASANYKVLAEHFGFTAEAVTRAARDML